MADQLDLLSLFQTVAGALSENQTKLNQADTHNSDHGDNMVQIFDLVSEVIEGMENATPSEQLMKAGQRLAKQQSGSAQIYSKGLMEAASTFEGKSITTDDAMTLVQTLLGGGNAAAGQSASPIDLFGSFLGGKDNGKLDAADLLSAGLSFLSAKQRGENTVEALVEALTSASLLNEAPYRAQSSEVVITSILENLASFTKK